MRYSYWTGSLGAPGKTFTYTYGDSNWKDKLTAFDGVPITYDAIGNPLSDGERYYTWACGRQLQSISMPLTGALNDFIVRKGVHRASNMELSLERSGSGMVAKVYRDGDDISASWVPASSGIAKAAMRRRTPPGRRAAPASAPSA